MRKTIAALLDNMFGLIGFAVSTVSGVLIVTLIAVELFGAVHNPYVGIITYMILPVVFGCGLLLMVIGIIRHRRLGQTSKFPVFDLNDAGLRRRAMAFVVLACFTVVILATTTVKAIEFMETPVFCGEVCHTVMEPEYTAYQSSPHANVLCVECHVGPGAGGFIEAKLNGAAQLAAVMFGSYDRPVATPVHNLPSAGATCQHCHWPGKYHGVIPRMFTRFAEDEANTETKTILLMNVGGLNNGGYSGIHWHADPSNVVRYRSSEDRETVYEVEWIAADGTVTRYSGTNDEIEPHTEWRTMECIDCHNRPAHVFVGAEDSVDRAMERGTISKDLPFIRREAVKALRAGYDTRTAAHDGIDTTILGFYETSYPDVARDRDDELVAATHALRSAYDRNVFPSMNVDWDTYPNHLGHVQSPGCFRCHAGNLATESGKTISLDCRVCHTIVAWDEASPEILEIVERRRLLQPGGGR